jgi:hypothetical protein
MSDTGVSGPMRYGYELAASPWQYQNPAERARIEAQAQAELLKRIAADGGALLDAAVGSWSEHLDESNPEDVRHWWLFRIRAVTA